VNINQQANALISSYVKQYEEKYKAKPSVNRYRDKWGFVSAIEDLGYGDTGKALAYFFTCDSPGHVLQVFFTNYDKLHITRLRVEEDARRRAKIRKETALRVQKLEEMEQNGEQ
jgi:hypothetical protein